MKQTKAAASRIFSADRIGFSSDDFRGSITFQSREDWLMEPLPFAKELVSAI